MSDPSVEDTLYMTEAQGRVPRIKSSTRSTCSTRLKKTLRTLRLCASALRTLTIEISD